MWNITDRYFQAAKNKDTGALDGIFRQDAVYVCSNGETYNGIGQIKQWFTKMISEGSFAAWDIRKVIQSGENGAVQYYFEYRGANGGGYSCDGVALVELSEGMIKRWSEFTQTTDKHYPLD